MESEKESRRSQWKRNKTSNAVKRVNDLAYRSNKLFEYDDLRTEIRRDDGSDFAVNSKQRRYSCQYIRKKPDKKFRLVARGKCPGNERQAEYDYYNRKPNEWSPKLQPRLFPAHFSLDFIERHRREDIWYEGVFKEDTDGVFGILYE